MNSDIKHTAIGTLVLLALFGFNYLSYTTGFNTAKNLTKLSSSQCYRSKATKMGCGGYNRTTGVWEWDKPAYTINDMERDMNKHTKNPTPPAPEIEIDKIDTVNRCD